MKTMKNHFLKNYLKCILACSYNVFLPPRESKRIVTLFFRHETLDDSILQGPSSDRKTVQKQIFKNFKDSIKTQPKTKAS